MTPNIPQTRKEAFAIGSPVYRGHWPCTRNSSHESVRLTRSGRCEECSIGEKILAKLARDEMREKALEWARNEVQKEQAREAKRAAREAEMEERRREALRLKRHQKKAAVLEESRKATEAATAPQKRDGAPTPLPILAEASLGPSAPFLEAPPWEHLGDCVGNAAPDDSPPW